MIKLIISLIIGSNVLYVWAMISPLPTSKTYELCMRSFNNPQTTEEQKDFACTATEKWEMDASGNIPKALTTVEVQWLKTLESFAALDRRLRFQCNRKEYRMLTDVERRRYHDVVNLLKSTKLSNGISQYDVFVKIHTASIAPGAHGGAAFLPWHREFLKRYELALRSFDPSVCLPYWDNTIDKQLQNPQHSIIWSKDFLGNGDGFVTTGPFARWRTPISGGTLDRNIESSSSNLMHNDFISEILQRPTLANISCRTNCDFEAAHSGVHLFVGGKMASLTSSPEDPVFFMHHAFLDCIWEDFRGNHGASAFTDYPVVNFGTTVNDPQSSMLPFQGLRNQDGVKSYSQYYRCSPRPKCSSVNLISGSKYLRCEQDATGANRVMTSTITQKPQTCDAITQKHPQNSYCINGQCDTGLWSFIPVSIVNIRPLGGVSGFYSNPVHNNNPLFDVDVYSGNHFPPSNHSSNSCPKGRHCCNDNQGVYLHAVGLNYHGSYKEFVNIDPRLPISSSEACVAVPDPKRYGSVKVRLRAADGCGRVCQPFCADINDRNQVKPGSYKPCNGDIVVDAQSPHMYSSSFQEAVNTLWQTFSTNDPTRLPQRQQKYDFVTFYCNHASNAKQPQASDPILQVTKEDAFPDIQISVPGFPDLNPDKLVKEPQIPYVEPEDPLFAKVKPEIPEPEFPYVQPEFPVVGPEFPEVDPEFPNVHPEFPEVHPEIPNVQPEFPDVQPEFPVEPEFPEVHPEFPNVQPESPIVEPEFPNVPPEFSVVAPEFPEVDPEFTVFDSIFPKAEPEIYNKQPSYPVIEPAHILPVPEFPNVVHAFPAVDPEVSEVEPDFTYVLPEFPEVGPELPKEGHSPQIVTQDNSTPEIVQQSIVPGASLNTVTSLNHRHLPNNPKPIIVKETTITRKPIFSEWSIPDALFNFPSLRIPYVSKSGTRQRYHYQIQSSPKSRVNTYSSRSIYPRRSSTYSNTRRSNTISRAPYWPRSFNMPNYFK